MKEKRAKKNNGKGVDRLSNLPDALLLHIFSFLPFKTCVNTSFVSQRYRNLWEHLQVLNVNENDFRFITSTDSFNNTSIYMKNTKSFSYMSLYVTAFIARRKSHDLRKFRLSCNLYKKDLSALHADMWIRTLIGPCLQELHLSISDVSFNFIFPLNLLSSCPKLLSLSLCGHIVLQWLPSWEVYLPLLKKLIVDLKHAEVPFLDNLLSCCPILEILEVSFCPTSLTTLRVPHSLKRLKRLNITSKYIFGTCLEVDATDLNYISLTRIKFEGSTIVNLHKVDEVYLDVVPLPGENLLSKIKHLVLGGLTTEWLFDVEFPDFQHLIHLELNLPCFNIGFLYQVLQKCSMLQTLKIKKHYKDQVPPKSKRVPKPKSVPSCLVSNLTFIHYKGFQGNLDEVKFIGYVLRTGLVLKTIHISYLSKVKVEDIILRNFFNTSKGSASCQLKYD